MGKIVNTDYPEERLDAVLRRLAHPNGTYPAGLSNLGMTNSWSARR